MRPREIRRLTEAEVQAKWLALYLAGKHAKAVREGHKPLSVIPGRDPIWVEVEIPHELYSSEWNADDARLSDAQLKRANEYANTNGALPPGIALFSGRRGSRKAYVSDGNHRAYAAFLRGLPAARFYMPAGDWTRFVAVNG